MSNNQNGIIIKGIGGFYYVKTAEGILECRAKGIFRKRKISPYAGDIVEVEGDESGYMVSEIKPRKNSFSRPPITNVDKLFLVISSCDPRPNIQIADELIAIVQNNDIKPIILITKTDLESAKEFAKIYSKAGFCVIDVMENENAAIAQIKKEVENSLCVFIGNSGVGKSTFLNKLCPNLGLETGETSKKLGRGKHTTRAVELYPFEGGYIADTPGFSAVDFERSSPIKSEEMAACFCEFANYVDYCYFTGCSHTVEKGCAILKAVEEGKIAKSRHESYVALYKKAKEAENKY